MQLRRAVALVSVLTAAFFVSAPQAFADSSVWTVAAQWEPGRVILGVASVLFTATLTRGLRD